MSRKSSSDQKVFEWFVPPVSDNGAFGKIRATFFMARLLSMEAILFLS